MATQNGNGTVPVLLWHFDRKALSEGDVLLEMGTGHFSPVVARLAGDGRFSHALIWVGNTDFVEAVSSGVRNISYLRVLTEEPERWLLLRASDAEAGRRAAISARACVSKSYDLRGALMSPAKVPVAEDPEAVFCSQLVARAYRDAGIELVTGVPLNKITPKALLNCSYFSHHRVPVVALGPSETGAPLEFLDRDSAYKNSLPDIGARIERAVFDTVKPLITGLVDPCIEGVRFPPGNHSELLDVLRSIPPDVARPIEDALASGHIETGYLNLLGQPFRETREWILINAIRLRSVLPTDERQRVRSRLADECRCWWESAQHHRRNAEICVGVLQWHPHSLWERLAEMYRANYQGFMQLRALAQDVLESS
jgi:hypothetical protein